MNADSITNDNYSHLHKFRIASPKRVGAHWNQLSRSFHVRGKGSAHDIFIETAIPRLFSVWVRTQTNERRLS